MKNIIYLLFLLHISYGLVNAQSWGQAGACHVNVNNPNYANLPIRQGAISATVKLLLNGECSGVLINRNTSDNDVGYYVLTAKHCVAGIDFNINHTVYFNYQSPGADNNMTAPTNKGIDVAQSTSSTDIGYEYKHVTRLRLVGSFTWGDFALIEILTPIPPHFNVTYAGWNPSSFSTVISTDHNPTDFFGVHHPRGDIKKISGTNSILWLQTPIAKGCYTITTIIDILFGWIWGNRVSTKVICNYVDNPWLTIANWQYGIVEDGSSGSGLFYWNNSLIGVLSGSLATCNFKALTTYGKLNANYSNASIKNTLNPNNDIWIDQFGLGERKITTYENLVLPGTNGNYFPANHYQSSNKISLNANNSIISTQPITIYSGADYEFIAGNSVKLGAGFTVQAGANFSAKIGTSRTLKSTKPTLEQDVLRKMRSIELPKYKKFEVDNYLLKESWSEENIQISEIYPNPSNGNFAFKLCSENLKGLLHIELLNIQGQAVYDDLFQFEHSAEININKPSIPKGFYILKVTGNNTLISKKLIIK